MYLTYTKQKINILQESAIETSQKRPNSHVASMVAMETDILIFTKFKLILAKNFL